LDLRNDAAYEVLSGLHQADADESFLLLQALSLHRRKGVLGFAIWKRDAGEIVLLPTHDACTLYMCWKCNFRLALFLSSLAVF